MACNGRGKQPLVLSEKAIWFFKIIVNTTLQDGKLRIPNSFTTKYGDNLPNPIFLKARDGIQWKVYWTRHDNGSIWLQKGWKEFATYYSLEYGHLLMFKYDETCNMKVIICNASALEIDYSRIFDNTHEIKNHTQGAQAHEKSRTNSSGLVGQRSSNLPQKVQARDMPQGRQPLKNLRTHSSEDVGQSSPLPQNVQSKDDMSQGPQPCKKLMTQSSGAVGQSSKSPQNVHRNDTSKEDMGGASTSKSEAPSFTIVLKPAYVKGYALVVPSIFAKKYLNEMHGEDFLFRILDGRTWLISYRYGRFCIGWKDFATDNNLKEEDICLFEFIKSRMAFEVTIIRGPQHPEKVRTHASGVVGQSSNVGQRSKLPIRVQTRDDKSQGPQPRKKLRTGSTGVVGQSSKLPQHVQEKSEQSQEDMGGALTSKSEAPSFTVILKTTYVKSYVLIVPSRFAKKHLNEKHGENFLLRVLDGRTWLISYKYGRFCTGWKNFATDNNLKEWDICLFEFTKCRMVFEVTIIRGDGNFVGTPDLKCKIDVPVEAIQESTRFRSRHPYFKVIIKVNPKGDYRLRVPIAFKKKYFNKKHTVILQFANRSWHVHLVGKCPTKLSKGWFPFAKAAELQVDDVCIFELIDRAGPVFNVHIFKGHS